jgi:hypothetical protein
MNLHKKNYTTYQNGFTAETVHCMNKTEQAV